VTAAVAAISIRFMENNKKRNSKLEDMPMKGFVIVGAAGSRGGDRGLRSLLIYCLSIIFAGFIGFRDMANDAQCVKKCQDLETQYNYSNAAPSRQMKHSNGDYPTPCQEDCRRALYPGR
jgi:hypothetical protein